MRIFKGKLPPNLLKEIVFNYLGVEREEVILGPSLGEDGALIRVGDKVIVSSMDPITGAVERIGWLAVNINANDVATFGIRPSYFSSCILLPEDSGRGEVEAICRQMDSAARRIGMAIVGGHIEVTPDMPRAVVVGCCLGIADDGRYVRTGGSKPGDMLLLTKGAGIEGTAILADERREYLLRFLDESLIESAASFYDRISVVEEAVSAFESGGVTAMHDPTEGGVAGGVHEMADASNLGFRVFEERIPVAPETSKICEVFRIDPLQLISSGALLISVRRDHVEEVVDRVSETGVNVAVIGEFLEDPGYRMIVGRDGSEKPLVRPLSDHLWTALERSQR